VPLGYFGSTGRFISFIGTCQARGALLLAGRYLQAEKKSHRTVKHIWFLPTQKPTLKNQKSLPFPTTTQTE